MSDMKSSIIIDLAGNLQARAKQHASSLQSLGRVGSRSMKGLHRSVKSVSNGLDRLGNRYTAILTGAAAIGTLRGIANLDKDLKQLQVDARATDKEMAALKQRLFEVAKDPNLRVDPAELLQGITEFVTKTGDLKFVVKNMSGLAVAIRATGTEGSDAGATLTNFYKGNVRDSKELLQVTDALIQQAKEGSVAYRDIARVGNGLFAPYLAAGKTGMQAFKDMNAVAQTTIDAVKSPEEAVTATTALLAQLKDPAMQKLLDGGGIKVFDGKEMRALPTLIDEIIKLTGGDITKLSSKFNESAIKVFEGALLEGNLDKMKRLAAITTDGSGVLADAAANASTLDAVMTSLGSTWEGFANRKLEAPIKALTKALGGLDAETADRWLGLATGVFGGAGALFVGNKVARLFRKRGKGIGSGMGGGLGGFAPGQAVPVYIVDGPMSILGGNKGAPGRGKKGFPKVIGTLGAVGTFGTAAGVATLPAILASLLGYASVKVGESLAEHEAGKASTPRLKELLSRHNVMGGGTTSYQSQLIKGELDRRFASGENMVDVGGTINLHITKDGNVQVKKIQSNNRSIDIDVDAGQMMRSH